VRGVFVHSRAALPHLIGRPAPAIVNLASISGLVGLASQTAYCATKGAIVQITRQLAVEFGPQGVRVNAVAPGAIDTPFLRDALIGAPDPEAIMADIAADHPLGRVSEPAEIAQVILFLASPRSGFVTGAILAADGGYTAA
jgi:NAD(P)-dependent dehydrogenase (short-subunit alcohol dehydrogenase family)